MATNNDDTLELLSEKLDQIAETLDEIKDDLLQKEQAPREGRCQTCRFWEVAADIPEAGFGYCDKLQGQAGQPMIAPTLAWAITFEEEDAYLLCNAGFGCIQWEKKQDE